MATKVASLFAEIGADTSGLKRGLDETKRGLSGLGDSMARTGAMMTAGLTLPIVAGFAKMVDSASDLSETMNKVSVVFGESADEVLTFGRDAAQALGMSQQTALEAAGTFGNLFTSMGMARDKSAEMSTSLLTLAADLASFNNIDPTVALEKLRAGLVGEVEPLRTLGVNLSAVAVAEKAVEMGLVAVGEELDPAAKAQAAYALIMEQTANAQGDFARTSDGLANTTRILRGRLSDVAAEMGESLLPYALKLAEKASDLLDWFSGLSDTSKDVTLGIAGIAAVAGPAIVVVGKLATAMSALGAANLAALGPIGLVAAGIGLIAYSINGLVQEAKEVEPVFHDVEAQTGGVRESLEEARVAMDNATLGFRELVGIAPQAMQEASAAAIDYRDKLSELQDMIAGGVGQEMENFADANARVADSMASIRDRIGELSAKLETEGLTAEERTELGLLAEEYNKLAGQYAANATAHEEATKRIIFDMAMQRAAADGIISQAEYDLLLSFAQGIGLIDEATATAMAGVSDALNMVETNAAGAELLLQRVLNRMLGVEDVIHRITGRHEIIFDVTVTGDQIPNNRDTYGNYIPIANAEGGDYFVTRPTLFLAGEAGPERAVFVPQGKALVEDGAASATKGGGDTYNVTLSVNGSVSNGEELYLEFKRALERDLRAVERSGVSTADY